MTSQNSRLEVKIDTDVGRLEDKVDSQGSELRDEMRAASVRVSNSELEQARLNGINSVLAFHLHTHDIPGN